MDAKLQIELTSKTVKYCYKELAGVYCRDLTSASESYKSHNHFSIKNPTAKRICFIRSCIRFQIY